MGDGVSDVACIAAFAAIGMILFARDILSEYPVTGVKESHGDVAAFDQRAMSIKLIVRVVRHAFAFVCKQIVGGVARVVVHVEVLLNERRTTTISQNEHSVYR
jgi:hypothetical protein